MSDDRVLRKYGSLMGSAHVESNPMGTSDESPQHSVPGLDRPTSTGLSGSRVVYVCNLFTNVSNGYTDVLHLDEDFLEPGKVFQSHLPIPLK